VTTSPSSRRSLAQIIDGLDDLGPADAETVKSCCAAVYGSDLVALFLGDSYHPGGAALTRRLAEAIDLQPGQRVLDVASGIGTTAMLLAAEFGVDVLGVDLGDAQLGRARERAALAGLSDRVRFRRGDAERLPMGDSKFDAVLCECAFCTFPNKDIAAAELTRAVHPAGRVGITDVWLDPGQLDSELRGLAGRVACLADARPIPELIAIVERAGLTVTHAERHDEALLEAIDRVTARIRALRLLDLPLLRRFNLARGISLAGRVAKAVEDGDAGYVLLTATKP
jgi:arsenite methyltransferase